MKGLRIDPARHAPVAHCKLTPPPSKSHTMRAILFGLMGSGTSHITHFLHSPDTEAMLHAIELLGAKIERTQTLLKIQGTGGHLLPPADVIHAGNSGQVLRFIGALAALSSHYTVFTGDHSVRSRRSIAPLLEALSQLGATALATRGNGYAPFIVKGPLHPGTAFFAGRDSQPVSALLIATSFLSGPSRLVIDEPGEVPWVGLTLQWIQKLGGTIKNHNFSEYIVQGGLHYGDFAVDIPGDFSSAAYPLAAALLHKREASLEGLDCEDAQGDKQLVSLLQSMGAELHWKKEEKQLVVQKTSSISGATIDVDPIIDALPVLAALGCYAEGTTHLMRAHTARHKESDRLFAMTSELRKMGAKVEEQESSLTIHHAPLRGAMLDSHSDHRIAMALTIAALGASTPSHISKADCISKSYPSFVSDMQAMGFCVEVVP